MSYDYDRFVGIVAVFWNFNVGDILCTYQHVNIDHS